MKVSVCVTIKNEKLEVVKKLLDALNDQTLKPNEIIIIDAKDYKNCNRSKGRNIAIKKARNEIIAITDAGCIPYKDWLEKISHPLGVMKYDVVSGGYKMIARNSFQKAESVFLGVNQKNIDKNFMPSARSMAFTKSIWKKAGGFPENIDTAEDTSFNLNLIKAGAKFVAVPSAIVDWQMPDRIKDFGLKINEYARGDAESGIWWHPKKKFSTHNIKVLSIIFRYVILISILFINWKISLLLAICYMLYAYKKAGLWGIILQFVSDLSAISGFIVGILKLMSLRGA